MVKTVTSTNGAYTGNSALKREKTSSVCVIPDGEANSVWTNALMVFGDMSVDSHANIVRVLYVTVITGIVCVCLDTEGVCVWRSVTGRLTGPTVVWIADVTGKIPKTVIISLEHAIVAPDSLEMRVKRTVQLGNSELDVNTTVTV